MPKFLFRKLVRDKLLERYLTAGYEVEHTSLQGIELKQALLDKAIEELAEVPARQVADQEVITEISDVQQALDDLKKVYGVSDTQVADAQAAKRAKNGAFETGLYVETVSIPEDDEWLEYYRSEPTKYPEITRDGKVDPVLPELEMGKYRHAKSGKLYDVLGVTFHTETLEPLVIYAPEYEGKYALFARPYQMFVEQIEIDGKPRRRFEKVSDGQKT